MHGFSLACLVKLLVLIFIHAMLNLRAIHENLQVNFDILPVAGYNKVDLETCTGWLIILNHHCDLVLILIDALPSLKHSYKFIADRNTIKLMVGQIVKENLSGPIFK